MLTFSLAELYRRGSLEIDRVIPLADPMLQDAGLKLREGVRVRVRATPIVSGEIWVKGRLQATLAGECRRCLEAVDVVVDEALSLLFAPTDELGAEEAGTDVRPMDAAAGQLDLGEPVREELLLAVPGFVVCDTDCRGLCPRCGANWNRESCDCTDDELDPRWDKLRTMLNQ